VDLPDYDELPLDDHGVRSAWGMFGPTDSAGLVNLLDQDIAVAAASLVRTGKTFALNAPLDFFDPPLFERPRLDRQTQAGRSEAVGDDPWWRWGLNEELNRFNPQASTQWDGLSHVSYRGDAFYNGATHDDIVRSGRNTVDHWARRGIVGRAVLLDLARGAEAAGERYDPASAHAFSVDDLERARRAAGVELRTGDILLLRTGFTAWYAQADPARRDALSDRDVMTACGIEHTEAMARYLWNSHVAAVAADCPAVEVWPMDHTVEAFPFGCLHQMLIGQFGLALGELWWLDDLAADCADDGVHEMLLTSAPMNYPSHGSPANALAIK